MSEYIHCDHCGAHFERPLAKELPLATLHITWNHLPNNSPGIKHICADCMAAFRSWLNEGEDRQQDLPLPQD